MIEQIANAVLAVLIIVVYTAWVVALIRWDGKCHCDKSGCGTCPYNGACSYQHEDE